MPRTNRLIPVVLAALAACSELPLLNPGLDRNEGEPVAITRFEGFVPAQNSTIATRERVVVENQAQWEIVWRRLWHNESSAPAAPAVDFTREVVVVAAMGGRPTGGYSIRVDQADARTDHVSVRVVETSPGRRCVVTMATTAPLDVVKLTRTGLPVRFQEVEAVRSCS